jgi:hypothetical protein
MCLPDPHRRADRHQARPGGGVIGIHGTNQPYLIPGWPSHGCIRVANRPIRRLALRPEQALVPNAQGP